MDMKALVDQATGDLARLYWTLECGSAPLARIYATMRHLRSELGFSDVEKMVQVEVRKGTVTTIAHPLHEGQYFYSLNAK